MLIPTIHDQNALCTVSVTLWSARRLDRTATRKLNETANASADASRVNKFLMAGADEQLRTIQRIGREARDALEKATLPWDDKGYRLIANAKIFEFLADINEIEVRFNQAVEQFVTDYPQLRTVALAALGDMADVTDYPPEDEIRQKFGITTKVQPIPTGFSDSRTGMTDDQRSALEQAFQADAQKVYYDALDSGFRRLRDNVERYVDRLGIVNGEPQRFTASMVESLRDTMHLLQSLNVFGDAGLESTATLINEKLCAHEPEELRNSLALSQATRMAAISALASIDGYLAG